MLTEEKKNADFFAGRRKINAKTFDSLVPFFFFFFLSTIEGP